MHTQYVCGITWMQADHLCIYVLKSCGMYPDMIESEIIASSLNQPMLASPQQLPYCCTVRGRNNGSITSSPAPSVYLAFHVHNILLSLSVSENMTPTEQSHIHCFKKMSQHMKKKNRGLLSKTVCL